MPRKDDTYEKYRESQAEISRERSSSGRDIGDIPPVVDQGRRDRGRNSLLAFCREYFPGRFRLGFADPHLTAIDRLQACTDSSGKFACAMPRGTGKTSLSEVAVIRAVVYGLRRFVLLEQATTPLAKASLKKIQREFEVNELLAADFPEVCYPIQKLDRISHRAKGQTYKREPTRIEWTDDGITLPTIPGAASSGAVLRVAGITSAVRGLSAAGPDGAVLRPDLVVIDDVQTRESARSPMQTAEREATILNDLLGLAGPDIEIAAVMLCTVTYANDLSDRFLSHERHPEWQGVRTRMIESFPTDREKWDRYREIQREALQTGDKSKPETKYYLANREAMDAGGQVSWPDRMKPGEASGLQSAMNLYLSNPIGFAAEYQNEPETDTLHAAKELAPAAVASKLSNVPRLDVPRECTRLAAFVDCGGLIHWHVVLAADERFNVSVIDYGTFPKQNRSYFDASDPRPSMADVPGWEKYAETQRVHAGIIAVTNGILGRSYIRAGTGEAIKITRCLVDAGKWPEAVQLACRQSPHAAVLTPSKGYARSSNARPMSEWKKNPGERVGLNWRLTSLGGAKGRQCVFDPDFWKSFVADRLLTPAGGAGCMTLFGDKPGVHELFADHVCAEYGTEESHRGGKFIKWRMRPDRRDNHWLDCLVGATVAASVDGLQWADSPTLTDTPRPVVARKKLSEIQAEKRAARGMR